jgi:hypothetical protein
VLSDQDLSPQKEDGVRDGTVEQSRKRRFVATSEIDLSTIKKTRLCQTKAQLPEKTDRAAKAQNCDSSCKVTN